MEVTEADIVAFARKLGWSPKGRIPDLFEDCGIAGDDGDEFLEAYAQFFSVDLEGFLWYFHYDSDEPPGLSEAWPHDASGARFPRIPLTPELLAQAANLGRWPLEYPEHVVRRSLWPGLAWLMSWVFGLALLGAVVSRLM